MMASMAKSCGQNQHAERLKTQGNELHQKGQYEAAYRKYTEAIKEDPKNAVYYANRAATSLALNEYMDASSDAKKATELDPSYAKAWARLGTAAYALSSWTESIKAWKKALECLPSVETQSTEKDKKFRSQFTEGLEKAEKSSRNPPEQNIKPFEGKIDDVPWNRALALEKELIAEEKISSGFVILTAYKGSKIGELSVFQDFKKGVDTMKGLEPQKTPTGQTCWSGKPDAIVDITNGLMRDPRVFHIDCNDWIDMYNRQVSFECQVFKGWNDGGAKVVKEEAPQRLKREGWQHVRPALALTIRAWMMRGFLANSTSRHMVAMEYYSRVIDILDWGRRTWQDVPLKDRGVIFELSFIRGAKRLRLAALHECLAAKTKECRYTLEDVAKLSRELIAETEANPPSPGSQIDPGFFGSFWLYPKGEALAILGWYHMQLALASDSAENAFAELSQSANYYIEAAMTFPEDEEKVPYYLKVAIEAYWYQNKPLKDIMSVISQIHHTYPKTLRFWKNSAMAESLDFALGQALAYALDCQQAIVDGSLSLESVVKPKVIKDQDKWASPNAIYI